MLSAAVDLQRFAIREFLPQHPAFPNLAAPLRTAADHVDHRHGPRPLMGLRPWLDGVEGPAGVELLGSALADGSRIGELLAGSARLWGGPPHASAALAWKTYCYWALVPAVLGYISARRVPLLDADNFVFTVSEDEPMFSGRQVRPQFAALPSDRMATVPGMEIVANEGALLRRMRVSLFEGHLEPVLEAIRREVRIGRRTLLGSLASGLAYAAANCSAVGRDSTEAVARLLLEVFDVADLVDVFTDEDGRFTYRRHTCCLAFTIKGRGLCSTCCVQTDQV